MTIEQQIQADIMEAMKAKDKDRLMALRAIKSAFLIEKTKEGAKGGDIDDTTAIQLITKQVKQRKDSAEIYKTQNRNDLYEKEIIELKFMETYLPKQMSEGELTAAISEIIKELGAGSPQDMGKVMGVATKKMAGKADGKAIAGKVKELLSS